MHGGHGTRLRPLTHTGPKQLLPISNKPMSQYALEDFREAGITDIGIIIGDVYPEKVKEYYGDGKNFGVKITYIYQDKPKGISHAIKLCKDFVNGEKFVVYLGDNILRKGLVDYKNKFESEDSDALILLCKVDDPSRFGIAELDTDYKTIKNIIEKPKTPKSDLAVIGVYFLNQKIFDVIEKLKPSARGELEITEALQLLMNEGNSIQYDTVTGWWKDTGTPQDILHANQLVLDSIGKENQFVIDTDAKINNNIVIGNSTEISSDAVIKGPVIIGKNCIIGSNVTLGPNVSIGSNSVLEKCQIENSIIMENCQIKANVNLSGSIIANGSQIEANSVQNTRELLLGERSHLKL